MNERHDHSDMAGLEAFRAFRAEMNERLIDSNHLGIKRFSSSGVRSSSRI